MKRIHNEISFDSTRGCDALPIKYHPSSGNGNDKRKKRNAPVQKDVMKFTDQFVILYKAPESRLVPPDPFSLRVSWAGSGHRD